MDTGSEDIEVLVTIEEIINIVKMLLLFVFFYQKHVTEPHRQQRRRRGFARVAYKLVDRMPDQISHLRNLTSVSDVTCIEQLRMDRNAFARLCYLLEHLGGLVRTRNVQLSEQVAIFLTILAHHKKNRVVKYDFKRSGHTISKHFNHVLDAVLRLHTILTVQPTPVDGTCNDNTWKWFKGCLGALDGTYIDVRVPLTEKPRYRNRKGHVSVNVLAVCDRDMKYVYVLSGWEGSAADSRVLRDAVTRTNGFRVPSGNYYLCDGGYTNGPGFLAPYRGVRYHLDEWGIGSASPRNYKELFNLRHAKARNIIERSFGILTQRWAILRSNSYYPIATQNRIIMACCLLHNFIRSTMSIDPMEAIIPDNYIAPQLQQQNNEDFVDVVEPSEEWTNWRESLANFMYEEWRANR